MYGDISFFMQAAVFTQESTQYISILEPVTSPCHLELAEYTRAIGTPNSVVMSSLTNPIRSTTNSFTK